MLRKTVEIRRLLQLEPGLKKTGAKKKMLLHTPLTLGSCASE